jgi:predicted O-methyltransferase YrrM
VFDLLTKCVYDKTKYPEYDILKSYRNSLLRNDKTIEVTDFGAGSKVFKSNTRKISDIAKNAGVSRKRAELLFRLTRYFKPENILEIGTSLGLATSALSLGNPSAQITTLEGCPETSAVAESRFKKFNLGNIDAIVTEFEAYPSYPTTNNQRPTTNNQLPKTNDQQPTIDLIYFDGNQQKNATLQYFNALLPSVTNDSIWIFDDIHWSAEMEEAWNTIKQNPKVTVTIDTFQWGLVFFRREQQKEHFVLRA